MNEELSDHRSHPSEKRAELARLITTKLRTPKFAALAVAVLVCVAAAIFTFTRAQTVDLGEAQTEKTLEALGATETGDSEFGSASARVFVHVIGAVQRPGVLELEANARVIDAIEAAGGAADGASLTAINLARTVTDGEQIKILTEAEVSATNQATASGQSEGSHLLNLNSADSSALESLPGVGPALAGRIIEWRKANGSFRSVDDLNEVSGIGDKMLASIRSLVTV